MKNAEKEIKTLKLKIVVLNLLCLNLIRNLKTPAYGPNYSYT